MKRNKILIPTLSALAIAPAIAIASCGTKDSTAEDIINAIIAPSKLTVETHVDLQTSFQNLTQEEGQKEVVYDIFGFCNKPGGAKVTFDKSLTKMWEDDIVSFKTNITKCKWEYKDNKFYSTFLGYISFVFNKETKGVFHSTEMIFKPNDYVMITYDFVDAIVDVKDDGHLEYSQKVEASETIMGIYKIKYNGGKDELMARAANPNTEYYDIKNSHNWKKK